MTFNPEQIAALKADLNRSHVAQREQAGRKLSYIEAWWAIAEANRIFGFDGWTRETLDLQMLGEPRLVDGKYRVGYRAKVRITVFPGGGVFEDGLIREGCGFGSGIDRDVDQAHESALKEAESDAMKRALMTFGNPFGLALYDKTQAHVSDAAPPSNDQPTPRQPAGRKTPAQAKRDGDHEKYTGEIDKLDTAGALDWMTRFDEYTADAPIQWLTPLRDRLQLRVEELKGQDTVAGAEAEMEEAFRGAIGSGSPARVSGNNGHVQAA